MTCQHHKSQMFFARHPIDGSLGFLCLECVKESRPSSVPLWWLLTVLFLLMSATEYLMQMVTPK